MLIATDDALMLDPIVGTQILSLWAAELRRDEDPDALQHASCEDRQARMDKGQID